jgi:adenylate cyclase class IV
MPTNLELKARIRSLSRAKAVAASFARFESTISQTDTYYAVPVGRLKLREFSAAKGELIFYARHEGPGDRYSHYEIAPTLEPQRLHRVMERALGVTVKIKKTRLLYLYKNARIHLDTVRSLGTFIEFEVIVIQGQSQARKLLAELTERFGVGKCDCIAGSYSDLMRS